MWLRHSQCYDLFRNVITAFYVDILQWFTSSLGKYPKVSCQQEEEEVEVTLMDMLHAK